MGDHRAYTDKNRRRMARTVAWHLGDAKAPCVARHRRRPPVTPKVVRPLLTVVEHEGYGATVRRKGWHLGDGKATLYGLKRDRLELPDRHPRSRPCGVCQEAAGLDGELWPSRPPPRRC
jgi:hypothetical protein